MQHITYNEWLPIVLGMKYMQKWSMEPSERGLIDSYNPKVSKRSDEHIARGPKEQMSEVFFKVNPAITNTFSTAAMRFGHSLIAGVIESFNKFGTKVQGITECLSEHIFLPDEVCAPDQESVCPL